MLPRVAIGRPNASVRANVDRYRLLVGDDLMDEVTRRRLASSVGFAFVT